MSDRGYECNGQNDPRYATSSYGPTILSAPAFEIRWRGQDLQQPAGPLSPPGVHTSPPPGKNSPTMPLTSKVSAPQSTTTGVVPLATPTPNSGIKLSTGAIVGIVIGALFGVCLIVLVATIIKRRRAQRRSANEDFETVALPKNSSDRNDELKPQGPMELSAEAKSVELSASNVYNVSSSSAWRASHVSVNKIPVELA